MQIIQLKPDNHRGQECMTMLFESDTAMEYVIRRIKDVKWSEEDQSWYLPLNRNYYTQLQQLVKGKAEFDNNLLKSYLQQRKTLLPTTSKDSHYLEN